MTAAHFDKLTDADIDALPALPLVIARCAPDTKVRMIEALHRRGKFAAMTGDGVNDAPSLNRADVGIAMGQGGSDVAKDASDIVLSDDNFASILNAVEEGRRMFCNIQKFVLHLLAQNVAQATVLLVGLAFKDHTGFSVYPISPVEIMWIIMITSSLPDMGLGFERASPEIMREPPKSLKKGVFTWEVILDTLVYGFWIALLCLAGFSFVMFRIGDGDLGDGCNRHFSDRCEEVFRARATAFACLTWFSVFLAWELVDPKQSFFLLGKSEGKKFWEVLWRNKTLFFSVQVGLLSLFIVLYVPYLNTKVFKHSGITWEWVVVFLNTVLFFGGVELWKFGKRRYFRRKHNKDIEAMTTKEDETMKMLGYQH
jgi:P-type Na+/K+ transporter